MIIPVTESSLLPFAYARSMSQTMPFKLARSTLGAGVLAEMGP